MSTGFYLYCFLEADGTQNYGSVGIDGQEVFSLVYDEISVVVSETDKKIIDPMRNYLLAHQQVVSLIMKQSNLVPVSFGTVVDSKDKLDELVQEMYPRLKELLAKVKDRVELGLKVFWTPDSFQKEMEEASSEVVRLKKQIREIGDDNPGKRYNLAVELGQRVEALANKKREEYKQRICSLLEKMAAEAKLNDVTNEKMIINASFLVDKDKEQEFDQAVDAIYQQYREYLNFKYTGPWPAYSFVDEFRRE